MCSMAVKCFGTSRNFCRKENCFLERILSEARSWLSESSGSGKGSGRGSVKWVRIKGQRISFEVLSCGFDSWKVSLICDAQDINAKIGFRAQFNYIWEYFPQQGLFAWGFGDTVVSEGWSIFWSWAVSFLVICGNKYSASLHSSYFINQICIYQDFNKTEKFLKLPFAFQ